MEHVFEAEREYYEQHRAEWLPGHTGEFAVIREHELVGFFSTYESAFRAGLTQFGLQAPFLIKQVWPQEPVFAIY
jgi:hypothetical protein